MKKLGILIGITVIIVVILAVTLFRFIQSIKKEIAYYKKLKPREKDFNSILYLVIFFPLLLWILDYFNLFSIFFPDFNRINTDLDWLSFIGSYSGALISSFLLIFITEKDRKANTNELRESQRPYLDIRYQIIKSDDFMLKLRNSLILDHGVSHGRAKKEYLTLCIKNNGASVAIIDPNSSVVKLQYLHNGKEKQIEAKLNLAAERLTIKSGEEIFIRFCNDLLYKNSFLLKDSKIIYSIVYYKDLFNKRYVDESILEDNLKIIKDNELIDD